VKGGNVLHHVKGRRNCPGGGNVGGIRPGDMSGEKCQDVLVLCIASMDGFLTSDLLAKIDAFLRWGYNISVH